MIWPLRRSPKSRNRTASSLGSEAWVLVRRRNSSLIRSKRIGGAQRLPLRKRESYEGKELVAGLAKLALTALQRSFHLRRKATRAFSTASRLVA